MKSDENGFGGISLSASPRRKRCSFFVKGSTELPPVENTQLALRTLRNVWSAGKAVARIVALSIGIPHVPYQLNVFGKMTRKTPLEESGDWHGAIKIDR